MKIGGSVELPAKHAQSLVAAIKRGHNKAVTRTTGVDDNNEPLKTVWKQEYNAKGRTPTPDDCTR